MNRRERLMRTFAGKSVDRPAVCFYEIDGFSQVPEDTDPFNIYNDPSWRPLLALAREKSDAIVSTGTGIMADNRPVNIIPEEYVEDKSRREGDRMITDTVIRCRDRVLTSSMVREKDINTTWVTEHLVKDTDDLKAWLELPLPELKGEVEMKKIAGLENAVGDNGCIMLNTSDPLCVVASLFEMSTFTIIALTEKDLFIKALDKAAAFLEWEVELISRALPGCLWRIYGPEYAGPPYLPPELFKEYVTGYDRRLVEIIHKYNGYARLHSHGNLMKILDYIADTGCMGLDPIEPPPQGDVQLSYVRKNYGKDMVLFGNLEASDIENLNEAAFREKVKTAIAEGTAGEGRGFVLMPSACPYGRRLSKTAMTNYETMISEIGKL
ncbi:MAG: uroporphyrinogen decarboxylase family protein [Victivallaceae bacterium]|nr:uroporphyrinogen decarboxylase family protein [Victivallaceae bacterium]